MPNLDKPITYITKSKPEPGAFKDFHFKYGKGIEFGPVPVDDVLTKIGASGLKLDTEDFKDKAWKDWPKEMDKACGRNCEWSAPNKKVGFNCESVLLYDAERDKKTLRRFADTQLEIEDVDLVTGKPTGIDWRAERCNDAAEKKGGACGAPNDPFAGPAPEAKGKPQTRTCLWPARVYMSDPERGRWSIEKQLLLEGKGESKYPKQEIATVRAAFWTALKEYVQEYKAFAAEQRLLWDQHLAYFTQVIGPMVEEALYINEMLNQMKNFLRAVSDWGQNPGELDPWPVGENGKLGDPLVGTQIVDLQSKDYEGYSKDLFVQAKDAQHSYFMEVNEMGRDQILGTALFEHIRRGALARGGGPEKYRVLFGSFVRTDRPNGDPDCGGAQQSLSFAQYLLEALGWYREDVTPKLTCKSA